MKSIQRHYIVFLLFILHFLFASAQSDKSIGITGKITEQNGLPIAYATVLLIDLSDNKVITGTTSLEDGSFALSSPHENISLQISFMGFETREIRDLSVNGNTVDAGSVILKENAEELDEIVVSGERSSTEFRLDKRVFHIGKELSNAGASALEALNNVPSVTVNMEGRISLRGSQGVQVLINGKPSVLTSGDSNALGTLTADMIESIEVITNPSAKYNAEGTSGIINIIIKKEEKQGTHGSATVNIGIPDNNSLGLSLNRRTEKWNIFGQLGIGRRTFPEEGTVINRDFLKGTELRMEGDRDLTEKFYNINLGADYHFSSSSVVTLSGRYALELEDSRSDFNYLLTDNIQETADSWIRSEDGEADNPKFEYELQYRKTFDKEEKHSLLLAALGSYFSKDNSSLYTTVEDGGSEDMLQKMKTDYELAEYTFKGDYTLPLSETVGLEAGSQYVITRVTNDYEVSDREGNDWIADPGFTNIFEYRQNVLAFYATLAYEKKDWGIKAGLRIENTALYTRLVTPPEKNNRTYTDFFPTLHTSYKISGAFSIQAGYSRRIKRPSLWDLNPFYSIQNDYDVFVGNPYLDPEYTDSYELTAITKWNDISFNAGIYHRHTTDVVENVLDFGNNTAVVSPDNVGSGSTTGVEANAKYNISEWLSLNLDFNYNYMDRNGELDNISFDFNTDQWQTRLLTKLKLPADVDLEFIGNYHSEYRNVQYTMNDNAYMDMGIRKKILKGKLVLNMSIRDVFASRRFNPVTLTEDYSQYKNEKNGRFVIFGLSFGFGKGEAMEYSGVKQF
ncbi:outer membrane beta-barrel family protein [Sinomicrobium soli]|uniref:outer membrane beta-barrel family protein n=1 Tax=Sinomicrobium sp. N-1-3-6 TaxID=2219864 RepID=UPI000DCC03F0|nr:outer membrane beta-barrel family protein [Sinomicrobium sp. N-1-3-6]RAV28418.1 TonB-dependent receptor [Sinomicrobium sp. N-1-3-6]